MIRFKLLLYALFFVINIKAIAGDPVNIIYKGPSGGFFSNVCEDINYMNTKSTLISSCKGDTGEYVFYALESCTIENNGYATLEWSCIKNGDIAPECPDGEIWDDNSSQCRPNCQSPRTYDDFLDKCVCPENETWNDNNQTCEPATCPDYLTWIDEKKGCFCDYGHTDNGSSCEIVKCDDGYIREPLPDGYNANSTVLIYDVPYYILIDDLGYALAICVETDYCNPVPYPDPYEGFAFQGVTISVDECYTAITNWGDGSGGYTLETDACPDEVGCYYNIPGIDYNPPEDNDTSPPDDNSTTPDPTDPPADDNSTTPDPTDPLADDNSTTPDPTDPLADDTGDGDSTDQTGSDGDSGSSNTTGGSSDDDGFQDKNSSDPAGGDGGVTDLPDESFDDLSDGIDKTFAEFGEFQENISNDFQSIYDGINNAKDTFSNGLQFQATGRSSFPSCASFTNPFNGQTLNFNPCEFGTAIAPIVSLLVNILLTILSVTMIIKTVLTFRGS